jgi:hypothetical protein
VSLPVQRYLVALTYSTDSTLQSLVKFRSLNLRLYICYYIVSALAVQRLATRIFCALPHTATNVVLALQATLGVLIAAQR